MATDTITLAVQAGDRESDDATSPLYMPLRKLLSVHCVGPYSKDIDELAFVLRIDGKIWHWEFEGCEELKVDRKERYITVDIGVPVARWKTDTRIALAKYLLECVEDGLKLMVHKMREMTLDVRAEKIFADFETVRREYLNAVAHHLNNEAEPKTK